MIKINYLVAVIITIILSSCGGNNNEIPKIKYYPVENGSEFQYIDEEGKIVINPQFRKATVFRGELALVQTSGDERNWGFISETGNYVIPANYKRATVFSEELAWVVSENAPPTAIDKNGAIKFTLQQAEKVKIFKEGLAAFSILDDEGEKWGFIDKNGTVLINPQFIKVENFNEGKCAVKDANGKWGYINKEGRISINYQFSNANSFSNGKAVVVSGGKHGVIDENGKYLINPQYSEMKIDGDMFLIKQGGKYGWCDNEGKIIINPQFSDAYPFLGSNLASVEIGSNRGFINKEGKIIINAQFDNALPFNGGISLVGSSGKIGFIDKEGTYTVNPQFDDISEDIMDYVLNGNSKYEDVTTDFFNIDAITSVVNFESLEGLSFTSTFGDILNKFDLNEEKLSKTSIDHKLISNKKISNDASFDFYAIGNPFKKIDWYTNAFDSSITPLKYAYKISLKGRGYGKSETVISAIETKLKEFTKNEENSNDTKSIYSNGKTNITLFKESSSSIIIALLKEEIEQEEIKEETKKNEVIEDTKKIIYYKIQDPDGFSNLRDKPKGSILKKVYVDDKFEVLATENNYKKIKLSDGTVGYIHESRVVKAN